MGILAGAIFMSPDFHRFLDCKMLNISGLGEFILAGAVFYPALDKVQTAAALFTLFSIT